MNCLPELAQQSDRDTVLDRRTHWKNLVFRKDGTSSYGRRIWLTALAAKEAADKCDGEIKALYSKGQLAQIITVDGSVYSDDYSHTIQVPHL